MKFLTELPFISELEIKGGEVYAVGGQVRDHLLGKQSKDIDLLVLRLEYDEIISVLEKHGKVDIVGKSFGVIKLSYKGQEIDISLPRTERKIGEGHTGFEIQSDPFLSLEEDLRRRDFTINAIAYRNGSYIDPFGGLQDMFKRRLLPVDVKTFSDDPLRILRAFQFAARFEFSIGWATLMDMKNNVKKLSEISGERVHTELLKLLRAKQKEINSTLVSMQTVGVWEVLLHPWAKPSLFSSSVYEIKSIPQLLLVVLGFKVTEWNKGIIDKLKLTREEVKEFEALVNVIEQQDRESIFYAAKKWPNIYKTEFFKFTPIDKYIQQFNRMEFPKTLKDIDITSEKLMEIGFDPVNLGLVQKEIIRAILNDEIENYQEDILDFMKNSSYISNLLKQSAL